MTQEQDNVLNMVNAVLNLFDQNPDVTESNPMVAQHKEDILGVRDDILQAAIKQKSNASKGRTEAKDRSRTMLEEKIFLLGVRMRTYAAATDNTVLAAPLSFSKSSLSRTKTHDLLMLGRLIVDTAASCLEDLEPFKIDGDMLDDLQTNIEEVATLYAERDTAVDSGMEATKQLARLFRLVRKTLKQMDDLVDGYVSDKTFVATYHNSRRIHAVR